MKVALHWLSVLCVILGGCAKTWDCHEGDFCVNGTLVEGIPAASQTPEMRDRIAREMQVSLAALHGSPDALRGWRLIYMPIGSELACPASTPDCDGLSHVGNSDSTIWVKVYDSRCLEFTVLPHEILHVILGGDPNHTDPQWATLGDLVGHEIMDGSPDPICHGLSDLAVKRWNLPVR